MVKAGLRSVAASFPGFASVAQAWNEAETAWRNERIDRFFAHLAQDMLRIKERIIEIQRRLTLRADLPALLERTVEKVRREASGKKTIRTKRFFAHSPEPIKMERRISNASPLRRSHERIAEVPGAFPHFNNC